MSEVEDMARPVVNGTGPDQAFAGRLSGGEESLEILASGEPNAHYLGQRLQFSSGAETFNAAGGVLGRAMQEIQAAKSVAIMFAVFPGLLGAYVADKIGGAALLVIYLIALAVACLIVLLAAMARRHDFVLSEWKLTVDGKGEAAGAVFDHIAHALVQRRAPVQYRVVSLPGLGSQYLQVRLGNYDVYISCFAFGADLYIGWTLWWGASYRDVKPKSAPAWLAWLGAPYFAWKELVAPKGQATMDISLVHQYDVAKALRECVHSVTRQGVEAAVGRVPMEGRGTIGSAVPSGADPAFATSPS